MPLFACLGTQPVSAFDAEPHLSYSCLECKSLVHLRKQKGKIPHFYHLKASPSCRLYSKSEEHLVIQLAIQKILIHATLEQPFPSIHRIADVVWEAPKIVFEIQCSPISEEEVKQREKDYGSIGYRIVWILDERLFNKRIVRKSEHYLRGRECYFVQIKPHLLFYDQLEIINFPKRIKKGSKIPIYLNKVHRIEQKESQLRQIKERMANSSLYFENDLIHKAMHPQFSDVFETWRSFELPQKRSSPMEFLKRGYLRLLERALQKVAKNG